MKNLFFSLSNHTLFKQKYKNRGLQEPRTLTSKKTPNDRLTNFYFYLANSKNL